MSAAELRRFESQLELLSYTEQLAIIEYLAKLLQKNHEPDSKDNEQDEVARINAVLDRIPESEQLKYCDVGIETVREALKNDSW
ncbi:MAG: hypothetical protein IJP62_00835 [Treponema sp.]|nr:hypothetical protein [Treponema sp.]